MLYPLIASRYHVKREQQMRPKGYTLVEGDATDLRSIVLEESLERQRTWRYWTGRSSIRTTAILCLACLISLILVPLLYLGTTTWSKRAGKCNSPRVRREWRSLSTEEKHNYIQAVHCLQDLPSEIAGRGSIYDDVVYVHMLIGSRSHAAASFLPWHRASLHIYETLLVEKCDLRIPAPYWDWELDHQSLETSSIWSPDTGFGGDGAATLPEGVGNGRCVVDGPFANTTRLYWEGHERPHCLGRAFKNFDTGESGKLSGTWFSPETMGEVKRSDTFVEFKEKLEGTVHNALHWGIRGDFSSMSAANEPLFWLHHGQIDRLWWNWQNDDPEGRKKEYQGVSFNTTEGRERQGTLNDLLEFGGLWGDIPVSQVMETRGQLLCYTY